MRKRATITAIGKYVPERILSNYDLEKIVDTSDEWIRTRTGIVERHIAAENEATSDLATGAFRDIQAKFNVDPEEIDLIIVSTVTPDMLFPSSASLVQYNIGAKNAWAFDLSAACAGFLYGIVVASQLIETGRSRKALVIGAEKMSSIIDYTDRSTCVLFGDAAGAAVLELAKDNDDSGIIDSILQTDGMGKDYLYILAGGSRYPASHETVDKKMHYVYQDGRTVFKFAVSKMADTSEEVLKRNSLTGEDVDLFIPHQANKRIIDSCAERLKLREEQVFSNIDRYGNSSAATIPVGLAEAYEEKRIKKGDIILLSAFGAGFNWGSVLLKWGIENV